LMRKAVSVAFLALVAAVFTMCFARVAGAQTGPSAPTGPSGPTASLNSPGAKTCADFTTQAAAQAFFTSNGGSKANNFDNLDPNRNGIACEGLPGTPSASASPTAAPTVAPAASPLPNNGIFSDIMAMSGFSLLEAGIGLSLLSERIRSGGKRAPLFVLKLLAKAARQGKEEVALADDVYIVRKPQAPAQTHADTRPAPRRRVSRPAVLLTPPIDQTPPSTRPQAPSAGGNEWTAALALENVRPDEDWPYFTPPEA